MKIPFTNLSVNNNHNLDLERAENDWLRYIQIISFFPDSIRLKMLDFALYSKSQIGQDIVAYGVSNCSKSGFFVEIGAADGKNNSNTISLEAIGWSGLLVEPISHNVSAIKKLRTAPVYAGVVAKQAGEIKFFEKKNSDLSTTLKPRFYQPSITSVVPAITGNELFAHYDVPNDFDILSVDTEGSELDVLHTIDFSIYRPKFICVEHNYRPGNEAQDYLKQFGYKQILKDQSLFDHWFVR